MLRSSSISSLLFFYPVDSEHLYSYSYRCQKLVSQLKTANSSFKLQLRDVAIVDDAYQNFLQGIKGLPVSYIFDRYRRSEGPLADTRQTLEDCSKQGVYPGQSPPRDAPSPSAEDDPFTDHADPGSTSHQVNTGVTGVLVYGARMCEYV